MGLNIDWGKNGEPPKITMTDDKKEVINRNLYEKFEDSDISQELIDECNNKSNGETLFIFDNRISNIVSEHFSKNSKETRVNNNIDLLFGNKYYVGDVLEFRDLPSRKSFYDTETKMIGESRYNYIYNYITNLGFKPSEWNMGREYEQVFSMEGLICVYLRLTPNLFIEIEHTNIDSSYSSIVGNTGNTIVYKGFFSRKQIESILTTEHKRDRKIEILTKKED